eukprot:EG_transcript_497
MPLLLSLRQTFTLVKRQLAAEPRDPTLAPPPPRPKPKPKRGRRPAAAAEVAEGDPDADPDPPIYDEAVGFVTAFAKALKLNLFHDAGSLEIIVGCLVHLLTLEGHHPPPGPAPRSGSGAPPPPLMKACLATFRVLLELPRRAGDTNSGTEGLPTSTSETDTGWGSSSIDAHAIALPALVPLLTVAYAATVTAGPLQLRAHILELLTRGLAPRPDAGDSVYRLLLQLCMPATAKLRTESRRLACDAFLQLFAALPPGSPHAAAALDFVALLAAAREDRQRLLAVELAAGLLARAHDPAALTPVPAEAVGRLLEGLLLRSNDTFPIARRAALSSLAGLMDQMTGNEALRTAFAAFLREPMAAELPAGPRGDEAPAVPSRRELLVATVLCRLREDKAWVRRASIQVMEMIVDAAEIPLDVDHVFTGIIEMSQLHAEESVLVRRQALNCLVSTCRKQFQKYQDLADPTPAALANAMDLPCRIVSTALLQAFVRDNDEGIKALAAAAVAELLLLPLESAHDRRLPCVWEVLSRLKHESLLLLARVSHSLSQQKRIKPSVIATLQREIRAGTGSVGAYELLASLSVGTPKGLDAKLITDCYFAQKPVLTAGNADGTHIFANVLKLLSRVALPEATGKEITADLLAALTTVQCYHTLVPHALRLLLALGAKRRKVVKDALQELLAGSQRAVQEFCKTRTLSGVDAVHLPVVVTRHILLLGELALLREGSEDRVEDRRPLLKVPQQVETYLQAIIQTPILEDTPASPLSVYSPFYRLDQRTPGRALSAQTPDVDLSQYSAISMSQMSQMSHLSCATARDFPANGAIPATMLSAALLTFGKLCLVNEALAKRYIAVFVNQLRKATHEIVKSNILAILADLCVEYSGSVDKYVPVMSWFMGDRSVLVRHTAVVLITQLLAEGFIKWKSFLFFSFLVAVADDNRIVANFAESALVKVLLPKQPNLFFNHFIEALFVLNGYQGHPVYNNGATPLHDSIYALAGEAGARKRLVLYRMLLRHMSQVHLYKLHQKLHTELLALCTEEGAVDGDFGAGSHLASSSVSINALSPPGAFIMTDAFAVLLLREMRLSARAPVADDDEEGGAEALHELNRRVYADMFHKHIELSVIPVLVDLKRWLQRHKSPYMRHLEEYLRMIMREYKHEIQNMLAADPQLAVELQYDLTRKGRAAMAPPPPLNRRQSGGAGAGGQTPGSVPAATPVSHASRASATPRLLSDPNVPVTPLSASTPPSVKRRYSLGVAPTAASAPDTSRVLFGTPISDHDRRFAELLGEDAAAEEQQRKRRRPLAMGA